jgi:hypothetical protein
MQTLSIKTTGCLGKSQQKTKKTNLIGENTMSAVSKVQCPPCSPKLEEIQMQDLPVAHRTLAKLEGKTQLHQIKKKFLEVKPVPHLTIDVDSAGKFTLKVTEEARERFLGEDQFLTSLAQKKANEVHSTSLKLKIAAISVLAIACFALSAASFTFVLSLANPSFFTILSGVLITDGALMGGILLSVCPFGLHEQIIYKTDRLTQERDNSRIEREEDLSQEVEDINTFFEQEQRQHRIDHFNALGTIDAICKVSTKNMNPEEIAAFRENIEQFAADGKLGIPEDEETFIPFTDADIINKNHRMFGESSTLNF